ncbi:hypothetical protein Esti_002441 [Eimeria stiedai]
MGSPSACHLFRGSPSGGPRDTPQGTPLNGPCLKPPSPPATAVAAEMVQPAAAAAAAASTAGQEHAGTNAAPSTPRPGSSSPNASRAACQGAPSLQRGGPVAGALRPSSVTSRVEGPLQSPQRAPTPTPSLPGGLVESSRKQRSSHVACNSSSSHSNSTRKRVETVPAAGGPWCRYTWSFAQHFADPALLELQVEAFAAAQQRLNMLRSSSGALQGALTPREKGPHPKAGDKGRPLPEDNPQEKPLMAALQHETQQQPQQQQQQQDKGGGFDIGQLVMVPLRVFGGTAVYVHPSFGGPQLGLPPDSLYYALDFMGPPWPAGGEETDNTGGAPPNQSRGGVLMLRRPLLLADSDALGFHEDGASECSTKLGVFAAACGPPQRSAVRICRYKPKQLPLLLLRGPRTDEDEWPVAVMDPQGPAIPKDHTTPIVLEHVTGVVQRLQCTDTSEGLVFPLPLPSLSRGPKGPLSQAGSPPCEAAGGPAQWGLVASKICSAAAFVLDCDVPAFLEAPGASLFRNNCQFCLVHLNGWPHVFLCSLPGVALRPGELLVHHAFDILGPPQQQQQIAAARAALRHRLAASMSSIRPPLSSSHSSSHSSSNSSSSNGSSNGSSNDSTGKSESDKKRSASCAFAEAFKWGPKETSSTKVGAPLGDMLTRGAPVSGAPNAMCARERALSLQQIYSQKGPQRHERCDICKLRDCSACSAAAATATAAATARETATVTAAATARETAPAADDQGQCALLQCDGCLLCYHRCCLGLPEGPPPPSSSEWLCGRCVQLGRQVAAVRGVPLPSLNEGPSGNSSVWRGPLLARDPLGGPSSLLRCSDDEALCSSAQSTVRGRAQVEALQGLLHAAAVGPPTPAEGALTFLTVPEFSDSPLPLKAAAAAAAANDSCGDSEGRPATSWVQQGERQLVQQQQRQQQYKFRLAAAWSQWQEAHERHKEVWALLSPCSRCFSERRTAGRGAPGAPLETAFFCRLVFLHLGAPDCRCWGAPEALQAAAAATQSLALLQGEGAWRTDTVWQQLQQRGGTPVLQAKAEVKGASKGPLLRLQESYSGKAAGRPPGVTVDELQGALREDIGLGAPPRPTHQLLQHRQQQQQIEQQQQQQIERIGCLLRWALCVLQRLHGEEVALKKLCSLALSRGAPWGSLINGSARGGPTSTQFPASQAESGAISAAAAAADGIPVLLLPPGGVAMGASTPSATAEASSTHSGEGQPADGAPTAPVPCGKGLHMRAPLWGLKEGGGSPHSSSDGEGSSTSLATCSVSSEETENEGSPLDRSSLGAFSGAPLETEQQRSFYRARGGGKRLSYCFSRETAEPPGAQGGPYPMRSSGGQPRGVPLQKRRRRGSSALPGSFERAPSPPAPSAASCRMQQRGRHATTAPMLGVRLRGLPRKPLLSPRDAERRGEAQTDSEADHVRQEGGAVERHVKEGARNLAQAGPQTAEGLRDREAACARGEEASTSDGVQLARQLAATGQGLRQQQELQRLQGAQGERQLPLEHEQQQRPKRQQQQQQQQQQLVFSDDNSSNVGESVAAAGPSGLSSTGPEASAKEGGPPLTEGAPPAADGDSLDLRVRALKPFAYPCISWSRVKRCFCLRVFQLIDQPPAEGPPAGASQAAEGEGPQGPPATKKRRGKLLYSRTFSIKTYGGLEEALSATYEAAKAVGYEPIGGPLDGTASQGAPSGASEGLLEATPAGAFSGAFAEGVTDGQAALAAEAGGVLAGGEGSPLKDARGTASKDRGKSGCSSKATASGDDETSGAPLESTGGLRLSKRWDVHANAPRGSGELPPGGFVSEKKNLAEDEAGGGAPSASGEGPPQRLSGAIEGPVERDRCSEPSTATLEAQKEKLETVLVGAPKVGSVSKEVPKRASAEAFVVIRRSPSSELPRARSEEASGKNRNRVSAEQQARGPSKPRTQETARPTVSPFKRRGSEQLDRAPRGAPEAFKHPRGAPKFRDLDPRSTTVPSPCHRGAPPVAAGAAASVAGAPSKRSPSRTKGEARKGPSPSTCSFARQRGPRQQGALPSSDSPWTDRAPLRHSSSSQIPWASPKPHTFGGAPRDRRGGQRPQQTHPPPHGSQAPTRGLCEEGAPVSSPNLYGADEDLLLKQQQQQQQQQQREQRKQQQEEQRRERVQPAKGGRYRNSRGRWTSRPVSPPSQEGAPYFESRVWTGAPRRACPHAVVEAPGRSSSPLSPKWPPASGFTRGPPRADLPTQPYPSAKARSSTRTHRSSITPLCSSRRRYRSSSSSRRRSSNWRRGSSSALRRCRNNRSISSRGQPWHSSSSSRRYRHSRVIDASVHTPEPVPPPRRQALTSSSGRRSRRSGSSCRRLGRSRRNSSSSSSSRRRIRRSSSNSSSSTPQRRTRRSRRGSSSSTGHRCCRRRRSSSSSRSRGRKVVQRDSSRRAPRSPLPRSPRRDSRAFRTRQQQQHHHQQEQLQQQQRSPGLRRNERWAPRRRPARYRSSSSSRSSSSKPSSRFERERAFWVPPSPYRRKTEGQRGTYASGLEPEGPLRESRRGGPPRSSRRSSESDSSNRRIRPPKRSWEAPPFTRPPATAAPPTLAAAARAASRSSSPARRASPQHGTRGPLVSRFHPGGPPRKSPSATSSSSVEAPIERSPVGPPPMRLREGPKSCSSRPGKVAATLEDLFGGAPSRVPPPSRLKVIKVALKGGSEKEGETSSAEQRQASPVSGRAAGS